VRYVQYYNNQTFNINTDTIVEETTETLNEFASIKEELESAGINELLLPIDHIATRIFHQDREDAILEIVKLTHHYPWGAYGIDEMDSSTNPTRNVYHMAEKYSPAKVFTAGNTGDFLQFIAQKPNPTEVFCINFGRSLHHIAYDIKEDEETAPDNHNIDKVINFMTKKGKTSPGGLTGSRAEGLRQIFMKRSELTGWVTEYVERFEGFHGFFTRKNVAFLTEAAGKDEGLRF
ncbi:MAG: hypothetical protein L3V56_13915, partial [Candidatus Magnetoovum sp. WYHC-5]|nr:hypothetical protein [Candidatus Magnetoovum sp. WYHC-5]